MATDSASKDQNDKNLENYYKFHAKIYDATRWSFLFGRDDLVDRVAKLPNTGRILEIGCGTGKNLVRLCKAMPEAKITGLDLSDQMLDVAEANLKTAGFSETTELVCQSYETPLKTGQPFDVIVFSYCLTMINPGYEKAIASAVEDLSDDGIIAVVDFHESIFPPFKKWMGMNHVRMDSHLIPELDKHFVAQTEEIQKAYLGVWEYVTYLGKKR